MRAPIATVVAALTLLGVAGCASTGEADDRRTVTIEVEHQLSLSGPVTIAIQEQNGPQRLLGTVGTGEAAKFTFRPARGGQYVLGSESQFSQVLLSSVFYIPDHVGTVVWDLAANHISTR